MKKPNIIFIFTDQQRFDTMGCYGQPLNVTPNLDELAKNGVLFENAFTCQPVCGPARACLQTGKYATETGCFRNGIALPISNENLANHLSNNGYEVGYIGKWHLASNNYPRSDPILTEKENFRTKPIPPERRGGYKDYWLASDVLEHTSNGYGGYLYDINENKVDFTGYRVDALTDFTLDYLNTRKLEKPFFLFLSYIEPHHQNDHHHYEGPIGSKEKFKNFVPPGDLKGKKGDWQEEYPDYLGCISSIDANFKRILDKLKERGILDNTIIIFTSDHGSHFKTRNSEYKRSCHESSIHIPLIIYGPGFYGGKRIKELVSLIDLPPTILDCAGIEVPKYMQGNSLKRLIQGNIVDWPKEVFIQISESQVGRAIRTEKWKYSVRAPNKIGYYHSKSDVYIEEFLYDLENDIYEQQNLVKDPNYKKIRLELAERLKYYMKKANEPDAMIIPYRSKMRLAILSLKLKKKT